MSTFYPSIFNDVLAPTTQGPSSSNTAGVYRITSIGRALLLGKPKTLQVEMCRKGGFYDTFYNMNSDKACLAGILGLDLVNSDLGQVYELAAQAGLAYEFRFTDRIEKIPTEMGVFTVTSDEETLTFTGISLGGGEILIREINGCPCTVTGRRQEALSLPCWAEPRIVPSVYPLAALEDPKPPFTDSVEMLSYAAEQQLPLWQAALDYECALTGLSEAEVWQVAEDTLQKAYAAVAAGHAGGFTFDGVTVPMVGALREKSAQATLFPLGSSHQAGLDALAMSEYGNAHGVIFCMPTGGASGILPASIRHGAQIMGKSHDDEVRALLTGGLMGTFFYPTHYHGAIGCQAEVGVAASMAAGALASYLSADPVVVEKAAVLAIQTLLGQVCDPIGGYPQVPCFIRNITAVPIAMTCANYALLGLDTCVTLSDMVQAVVRVGEQLRAGRINDLGTCGGPYTPHPDSPCARCQGR